MQDAVRTKTGYANIVTTVTPSHADEAFSGIRVYSGKCDDAKVCGRTAFGPTRKDLGTEGICLSRATMSNWVIQCAQTWLKPLYRRMKKTLLECSVIHADETVVQVLKEEGKAATSESRMWVYANNDRSGKPIRYFEYQPDRSGKHAGSVSERFLRLSGNRRLCRIQPGGRCDPLRMLESYAALLA